MDPHRFSHAVPVHGVGRVAVRTDGQDLAGAEVEVVVPHRERLEVTSDQEYPARRARAQQVGAQLEDERRHLRGIRAGAGRTADAPPRVLDEKHRALQLGESPENHAGIHREPHGLVEGSGREVQIEKAIRIAPMALEVPIACIEKIKAAELKPGPTIVRGSSEIATEQVDRHLPLAAPLERGGPRGNVRIDGRLGRKTAGQE
jgi:hypothetical protein